jgi:ATP-dependent helicase HepA
LFRKFAQSFCDPVALWEITSALLTATGGTSVDLQMFDANAAFDYDEHDVILEGLGEVFADRLDRTQLSELADLLRTAVDVPEQSRMTALLAHLEELFAQGAAKVLVFAGTFGAAEYVLEALTGKFSAPAVASFRHDLKDDEKEKQVTRFRRDPACRILVSDESGGEGRNFQFADEIVHFDLPWSVAAVEQRIGRLDRIGRDRAVRSSVICPSSGLEYAWFRCLAEGFSVFNRSISGLEFMLNEAERQAVTVAANDGPEGLVDLLSQLLATSERERATDDAEAMTDAASFHNANRYLQAREHSGDELLEKWLPSYLRAIKDLNLRIWRLKPEDVSDYQLVGIERQGENPLAEVFGTFTRAVARERPDLDFFAVGHPLVDALAVAAREHVRGRSLLARFSTDLVAPGLVVLAGWRARAQTNADPVPERALRRLEGRVVWTAMDLETGEPLDGTIAAQLANQLRAEDAIAHDLDPDHAVEAFQPVAGQWSATLNELVALAASRATGLYGARYGQSDAGFCEQLRADARTVVSTRIEESEGYGKEVEAIVAAIGAAQVTLDVLGLLQIVAPVAP